MIKFPKLHIATSVVNRILNVHDGIEAQRATSTDRAPNDPMPAVESAVLEQRLNAPQPEVTADDPTAAAIALKGLV